MPTFLANVIVGRCAVDAVDRINNVPLVFDVAVAAVYVGTCFLLVYSRARVLAQERVEIIVVEGVQVG